MKCPKCGYENREDATFCDLCKEVLVKIAKPIENAELVQAFHPKFYLIDLLTVVVILILPILFFCYLDIGFVGIEYFETFFLKRLIGIVCDGFYLSVPAMIFLVMNRTVRTNKIKFYWCFVAIGIALLTKKFPWFNFIPVITAIWIPKTKLLFLKTFLATFTAGTIVLTISYHLLPKAGWSYQFFLSFIWLFSLQLAFVNMMTSKRSK